MQYELEEEMLRIAICDDEQKFINHYVKIINQIKQENDFAFNVAAYTDGNQLLNAGICYDLYLLDVVMPNLGGFDLAHNIRENQPDAIIVFLTSSKEQAYLGYAVKPLDYLLKPIEQQQLLIILQEAISLLKMRDQKIKLPVGDTKEIALQLSDIIYIESLNRKVFVHTTHDVIEVRLNLKQIEQQFSIYDFAKVHKSYVVNLNKIINYKENQLILTKGQSVPIGRVFKKNFKVLYAEFLMS